MRAARWIGATSLGLGFYSLNPVRFGARSRCARPNGTDFPALVGAAKQAAQRLHSSHLGRPQDASVARIRDVETPRAVPDGAIEEILARDIGPRKVHGLGGERPLTLHASHP